MRTPAALPSGPAQRQLPGPTQRQLQRRGPRRRLTLLATLAGCLLALLGPGCAPSERPYRFASPLLGGAGLPSGAESFDEATSESTGDPAGATSRGAVARRDGRIKDRRDTRTRAPMPPVRSTLDPNAIARHQPDASAGKSPGNGAGQSSGKRSSEPPVPRTLGAAADPIEPRSWVGVRDDRDPLLAVLELCGRRNPRCPQGEDNVALLRNREAWLAASTAFTVGDLLLFDRVGLDNGEQIFALVTARQARGVFELAYLAAGVWRRGFIDPARPRLHRDGSGAVVNTFLRHRRARLPQGTRFLTGELLIGVLPLQAGEPARPQLASW